MNLFEHIAMPKAASPADTLSETLIQPSSFETGLSELNALVARMEAGDAPLADMLAHYQRGTALLQYCESQLKNAEQQLQVLDGGVLKPLAL